MRPPTPQEARKLRAEWERRLTREGLGAIGGRGHWTFPAATAKGAGFYQLKSCGQSRMMLGNDGRTGQGRDHVSDNSFTIEARAFHRDQSLSLADSPTAVLFRRLSHMAHGLPDGYRGRRLIIAFAESGCMRSAARFCRVNHFRVRRALKRFCAEYGFEFRAFFRSQQIPVS